MLVLGDVAWLATGGGLAMAVFLGAVPTALAYVLFARGLSSLTPGETATLTLAEPLTAAGLGIVALGERPGAVAAAGAGLVLAGLLALAVPGRRGARRRDGPAPKPARPPPHRSARRRPDGAAARPRRRPPPAGARAVRPRRAAHPGDGARPGGGARMSERFGLGRVSTVDAVAAALRTRILDGELGPGERLREAELTTAYGVARHSLRAALRALAAEGLVVIEPNRGATVARLTPDGAGPLFELRTALELEAAHLALERNDGRLPKPVRDAVRLLDAVCSQPDPPWSAVVDAHGAVHGAIVAAARSPRLERAHAGLAGELRLFVIQIKPSWTLDRMAEHHDRLLEELEREGPPALRRHLDEGRRSFAPAG